MSTLKKKKNKQNTRSIPKCTHLESFSILLKINPNPLTSPLKKNLENTVKTPCGVCGHDEPEESNRERRR